MALVIRKQCAANGARLARRFGGRAPSDVVAVVDQRYGDERDARLDVYTPGEAARAGRRLPTVVWIHGGGFVGGSKEELAYYLELIAAAGFTVVGVGYSL